MRRIPVKSGSKVFPDGHRALHTLTRGSITSSIFASSRVGGCLLRFVPMGGKWFGSGPPLSEGLRGLARVCKAVEHFGKIGGNILKSALPSESFR